jgi:hypothetical protein
MAILGTVGEITLWDATPGVVRVQQVPEEDVPNLARRESRVPLDLWSTDL